MAEDQYYLTTNPDPEHPGKLISVISLGHPQLGDKNVEVLDVGRFKDQRSADRWFKKQMKLKPWETRQ